MAFGHRMGVMFLEVRVAGKKAADKTVGVGKKAAETKASIAGKTVGGAEAAGSGDKTSDTDAGSMAGSGRRVVPPPAEHHGLGGPGVTAKGKARSAGKGVHSRESSAKAEGAPSAEGTTVATARSRQGVGEFAGEALGDWVRPAADPALSDGLNALMRGPRVRVRRGGVPATDGACVLYWCQRSQRGMDNHAMDVAVGAANELGLPLVVYFAGISNFPHANLRHYAFLNQGLPDLAEECAERGATFVFRRAPHEDHLRLIHDVRAAMVIGDENPMRVPESWRAELAKRVEVPFWTVDSECIVPMALFGKAQYAAYTMRPKLYKWLPQFLTAYANPTVAKRWAKPKGFQEDDPREDMTRGWKDLDRSVGPVEAWRGGAKAARERLQVFLTRVLPHYDETRNQPQMDGTTRLSPWLHYGHISGQTIALAVDEAAVGNPAYAPARDSLYNELIAWRELCVNFVKYQPDYDNIRCAEEWAKRTIAEHAGDKREHLYTVEQMERGETYDELWNAAQVQAVAHGWMHNYLRMYWGKKILEWSPDNATAFERTVYLNDKYFLDGRDPGGYAGIAWAIAGKFDRPWNQHPVFGKVRYMSGASTGRKFDSKRYIAEMRALKEQHEASAAAPEDVATGG